MRLPRDLSGRDLARRLERQYGYRVTRTKESHMTATRTNDPVMCDSVHASPPGSDNRLQHLLVDLGLGSRGVRITD